jgi:ferredoxin
MRRLRIIVRTSVLILALICAMPFTLPGWLTGGVTSISPFLTCMALLTKAFGFFLTIGIMMGVISLFVPRFFCRWICPSGTCQQMAVALSPVKKKARWFITFPRIGKVLFLAAVGGAIVGYPLFIWLDPVSLFLASTGLLIRWKTLSLSTAFLAMGMPFLILLAVLAPGMWCGKICPTGALQDFLWALSRRVKQWMDPQGTPSGSQGAFGRRAFLGLGLGVGYRLVVPRRIGKPKGEALRPPWSMSPGAFEALCARCGACVRACPSRIIKYGGAEEGIGAWLAPEIDFADGRYCPEACTECGKVCPSGAIGRFTVASKEQAPIGIVEIDDDYCRLAEGRGCGFCILECPRNALRIIFDRTRRYRRVQIDSEKCTGCGKCLRVCPVDVMRVVRKQ